jgi:hypothetical protein
MDSLGYLHRWTANLPERLPCRWKVVPFSTAGASKPIGMQAVLQSTATAGGVLCDRYAFSHGHVSLEVGERKRRAEKKGRENRKERGRKRRKKRKKEEK